MLQFNIILLTSVIFAVCESVAILNKITKKCSITDDDCMGDLYKSLLQEIADNGIPELDVPKIDPLVLKDTEILALGMIKLTMKEGEAKGFKDCYATSYKKRVTAALAQATEGTWIGFSQQKSDTPFRFTQSILESLYDLQTQIKLKMGQDYMEEENVLRVPQVALDKGRKNMMIYNLSLKHNHFLRNDLETQRVTIDFVCERFSIEGSYKIESTPTLLALLGGIKIHGEGNGGIVIENVYLSFDFAFEVKKLDDCELHILSIPDESSYDFDVKGKATVHADNLFIGKQEISAVAVNIFNENWEFITRNLGKTVVDKAMELFFEQSQIFFIKVPAKEFVTDDLSSYVKE